MGHRFFGLRLSLDYSGTVAEGALTAPGRSAVETIRASAIGSGLHVANRIAAMTAAHTVTAMPCPDAFVTKCQHSPLPPSLAKWPSQFAK